jgi:hypothetical protein
MDIHIMETVMVCPHNIRTRSSSSNPTQIKKILRAGMRFEKGMGRGSERIAEERIIDNPQMM